ncbi:MAG: peptidylprolyl isomerase [Inquilinaceae bacterium]
MFRTGLAVLTGAIALSVVLSATAPPVMAQSVEGIAAVVNDEVISASDLEARLRLSLFAAGLAPTDENRNRLMPQVIRSLIDERLRAQEAQRFEVEAEQENVDAAIADIAGQNNMTPEQLEALLARNNIPISSLRTQIANNIAWARLVQRRLMPTVAIGDEEVDEALARIEANRGKPEYLVAELFLTVDDPAREAEVATLADDLVQQIRGGASFAAVARQFSQAAGAANGGDLGWVVEGQLDPELEQVVRTLGTGQVSDPIRTLTGYHVILLRDRRRALMADPGDAVVTIRQLALGYPPGAGQAQRQRVFDIAQDASRTVNGCDALQAKADELGLDSANDGTTSRLGDLRPDLRSIVEALPVGEPSPPQRVDQGVIVLMVCDRQAPANDGTPSRDQILESLGQDRMDMLQRRYLRDLRNAAFIDVRV